MRLALALSLALAAGALSLTPTDAHAQQVATADTWETITGTYVTSDGGFRYEALRANAEHVAALDAHVAAIGAADVSGWSRAAQLAFYINAYNALVVHSVLAHWPVESVLNEDGFFDGDTFTVAGASMTLNALENDIIRAQYAEPRIHFAVNCASTGCPPLADDPYEASTLDARLDAATRAYIVQIAAIGGAGEGFPASQIFEWFEGDFAAAGGPLAFIQAHTDGALHAAAEAAGSLRFIPYDWSLNAR